MSLKYVDNYGNEENIAGIGKDGSTVNAIGRLSSGTAIGDIVIDGAVTTFYSPSQAYFVLERQNYTSNQTVTSTPLVVTTQTLTLPAGVYFITCNNFSVTLSGTGGQFNVDFLEDEKVLTSMVNLAYFGNNQLTGSIFGSNFVRLNGGTHSYSWRLRTSGNKTAIVPAYSTMYFRGFKVAD